MKTLLLKSASSDLKKAARILRKGGVVAFPTETVYGLGANALDRTALRKIFKAKGRPSDNPLIVHIANRAMLRSLVSEIPPSAVLLMKKFWPGPLTLVFKRSPKVSDEITAGLDSVAIRMPAHAVAHALIRESGTPLAAPSANTSGKPSPTDAAHVIEDLNGRIDAVIDGGPSQLGLESTVVDVTGVTPIILRQGAVTRAMLEEVVGKARVYHSRSVKKPRSPGMKYRHYAPKADLYLVTRSDLASAALQYFRRNPKARIAVITTQKDLSFPKINTLLIGPEPEAIAHDLFRILRKLDKRQFNVIFCERFSRKGIGAAIMNRLQKASGK